MRVLWAAALVIVTGAQGTQTVEAQPDLGIVVLPALVYLAPALLAGQLIMLHSRVTPFVVACALVHLALKLLKFARLPHGDTSGKHYVVSQDKTLVGRIPA